MAEKFNHIVLIVDDEEQVGRAVGRLMKQIGVKYVYMDSGAAGLDRIRTASNPFSLIISDQRMPGMTGSEFLEKAKEAAPDTLRFLLTGYADVDAVTQAVNKGSIHRYIAKPWNNKEFIETVKAGLEQYELIVENDRLFKLAKDQNTKLFTVNKELKKSTAVHQKAIIQRDKEIAKLKKRLEIGFENRNYINEIETMLKEHDILEPEKINTLYAAIIAELFEQFQDIATRNGFEMPDNIPEDRMPKTEEYGILVVDDDEPIVKNMRRVLKRKGFTKVISALNGEQGIKLLEDSRNHFFLIMSDQRMPGLSGSEFLERSILLSPESRRMLITGYSDYDAIVDAVNLGEIHQYISKPWNNDDLLLKIQTEHDIFNQFQERKHLFNLTKHQNAKLFDVAAKQKKNLDAFTRQLEEKKVQIEDLVQSLAEAKESAEYKEVFLGLDELLSRTITMNQKNLVEAFVISKNGVMDTLATIAQRNKIKFSPAPGMPAVEQELADDTYDVIDQIIENVVQAVEPALFGIGSEPSTGMGIDDYTEVPDFGVLAFNDGYITKGELEMAQEELAERESGQSTGLTIDKVLIEKEFLRRKDLSRLFAKVALIDTRLLDRDFAEILIHREIASKKDTDRAFRKQLNNFEDSGVSMLVGDILVESEVIAPELRDEIIAGQDRSGKNKRQASTNAFSAEFGAFVDLQVSEDRVQAWIRVPKVVHGTTDVAPIKALIKKRGITNGVVKDAKIKEFIKNCTDPHEKFVVAQGIPASVGKPAKIEYHFNTEHEGAGVIREDGSIDFTARGDSPFVKKGDILAEKHPMAHPKPGMDIFGETLLVGEVEDMPLQGGEGVKFSDDELQLIAVMSGQPSLDAKGVVSVLEQFTVKGDVDFKTGNINFSGNVLVTGTVKEGFTVECDDLTANEVNGATILIRGDLKVSNGIVNSHVETQGSVQAKFINNVKLFANGNMMVTREIMGSKILISGALNNETGRITDSLIAARLGFSVKQIGTEKAEISTIKTGADDHILWVSQRFDQKISKIQQTLDLVITEKRELDDEHNALHVDVANQTFAQEKLNKKMEFIEKMMGKAGSKEERIKLAQDLKEIEISIDQADERIRAIFQNQDEVMQKINECDGKIQDSNDRIQAIEKEKNVIVTRLEREDPIPLLTVTKKVYRGTKIMGTAASFILQNEMGATKFIEIDTGNSEAPKQITHQTINI